MAGVLIVCGGIAAFVVTVISLHRARRRAYTRDMREAKMFWWRLEMERDFERSKEQWR